jgi:hypothetical protein
MEGRGGRREVNSLRQDFRFGATREVNPNHADASVCQLPRGGCTSPAEMTGDQNAESTVVTLGTAPRSNGPHYANDARVWIKDQLDQL